MHFIGYYRCRRLYLTYQYFRASNTDETNVIISYLTQSRLFTINNKRWQVVFVPLSTLLGPALQMKLL